MEFKIQIFQGWKVIESGLGPSLLTTVSKSDMRSSFNIAITP